MLGAPVERVRTVIARDDLQVLIDTLAVRGYQVPGPTLRNGTIIYGEIAGLKDLPVGWTEPHWLAACLRSLSW